MRLLLYAVLIPCLALPGVTRGDEQGGEGSSSDSAPAKAEKAKKGKPADKKPADDKKEADGEDDEEADAPRRERGLRDSLNSPRPHARSLSSARVLGRSSPSAHGSLAAKVYDGGERKDGPPYFASAGVADASGLPQAPRGWEFSPPGRAPASAWELFHPSRPPPSDEPPPPGREGEKPNPYAVKLCVGGGCSGSGSIMDSWLDESGKFYLNLVLTAGHMMGPNPRITAVGETAVSSLGGGKFIARGPGDVALALIPTPFQLPAVPVVGADYAPASGQRVWAGGYPGAGAYNQRATFVAGMGGDTVLTQGRPIPGESGGPLVVNDPSSPDYKKQMGVCSATGCYGYYPGPRDINALLAKVGFTGPHDSLARDFGAAADGSGASKAGVGGLNLTLATPFFGDGKEVASSGGGRGVGGAGGGGGGKKKPTLGCAASAHAADGSPEPADAGGPERRLLAVLAARFLRRRVWVFRSIS